MNVITIMNYDWSNKNYSAMCYAWIKQVQKWLTKNDTCIIFSKKNLPNYIINLIKSSETCKFKICVRDGFEKKIIIPCSIICDKYLKENISYKLYIICSISFPFVFLDSDAFLVGSLDKIEKILRSNQELVFIDHENNLEETKNLPPFINSGFFIKNDKKNIINWEKLYNYAKKNDFNFYFKNKKIIPGTDQSLIKSYLDYINYDYHNNEIDTRYNTYAGSVSRIEKNKEGLWKAYKDELEIKVIHYWSNLKPWVTNCPIFTETINDEMFNNHFILAETR